MNEFLKSFSNREISVVIWTLILFFFFLFNNKKAFTNLILSVFQKKLLQFYLVFSLYFFSIIKILNYLNLWEIQFYKNFLFWFVSSGILLFFNITNLKNNKDFITIIIKLLTLNLIIETIISQHSFSLFTELIMIPVIGLIYTLKVFNDNNIKTESHIRVSKFLNFSLIIFGIFITFYTINVIYNRPEKILTISNLKSSMFSPVFTILFIPIIYLVSVFIKYDDINRFLKRYKFIDNKRKKQIKLAIIKHANINLNNLERAKNILIRNKFELKNEVNIKNYILLKMKNQ